MGTKEVNLVVNRMHMESEVVGSFPTERSGSEAPRLPRKILSEAVAGR